MNAPWLAKELQNQIHTVMTIANESYTFLRVRFCPGWVQDAELPILIRVPQTNLQLICCKNEQHFMEFWKWMAFRYDQQVSVPWS